MAADDKGDAVHPGCSTPKEPSGWWKPVFAVCSDDVISGSGTCGGPEIASKIDSDGGIAGRRSSLPERLAADMAAVKKRSKWLWPTVAVDVGLESVVVDEVTVADMAPLVGGVRLLIDSCLMIFLYLLRRF